MPSRPTPYPAIHPCLEPRSVPPDREREEASICSYKRLTLNRSVRDFTLKAIFWTPFQSTLLINVWQPSHQRPSDPRTFLKFTGAVQSALIPWMAVLVGGSSRRRSGREPMVPPDCRKAGLFLQCRFQPDHNLLCCGDRGEESLRATARKVTK